MKKANQLSKLEKSLNCRTNGLNQNQNFKQIARAYFFAFFAD